MSDLAPKPSAPPIWPHLAVLGLLAYYLPTLGPETTFLSITLGHVHRMTPDTLGGLLHCLCVLGFAAYAATLLLRPRLWLEILRIAVVLLVLFAFVVMPTISDIAVRHTWGMVHNGHLVSMAHDGGVLQTEAALELMCERISPYSADYSHTEMAQSLDSSPAMWEAMGYTANPGYSFFAYPPFILELSLPFRAVMTTMAGWYDQRVVYLAALVALCTVSMLLTRRAESHAPLLAFLAINPFLAAFFPAGRNDIVCLVFLVAMVAALVNRRMLLGATMLALACGTKQFAWFYIPLFAALFLSPASKDRRRTLIRSAVIFLVVSAAIWLPFALWDPRGLFHDIILPQGSGFPYRPRGFGIADMLIFFNQIDTFRDPLSLTIPAILSGSIILAIGCWRAYRHAKLDESLMWCGAALFAFLFFNRYVAANHFGMVVSLWVLGAALRTMPPAALPKPESA